MKKKMDKIFRKVKDLNSRVFQSILNAEAEREMGFLQRKKVLIIDDDQSIQDLLTQQFKSFGDIILINALSAAEGLRVILEQSPDLVLIDINLPKVSGIQLSKAIDNLDERKTPFIFISSDEKLLKETEFEFGKRGFYLKKPIDKNQLIKILNNKVFKK